MNIDENEYGIDSCTMSMNWQWRCPISQDESWAVTNNEYTHLNIWMSYYVVVYAHIVRSFLCIWVLSRMSSHWIYFIDYLYIPHGLNYPTQTWALILDLVLLLTEFRLNPMKKKITDWSGSQFRDIKISVSVYLFKDQIRGRSKNRIDLRAESIDYGIAIKKMDIIWG